MKAKLQSRKPPHPGGQGYSADSRHTSVTSFFVPPSTSSITLTVAPLVAVTTPGYETPFVRDTYLIRCPTGNALSSGNSSSSISSSTELQPPIVVQSTGSGV